MGRKAFLFLAIIFCISTSIIQAQNSESSGASQYFVTGKIQDESNEALEYATVQVHSTQDSALVTGGVSDAKGFFRVPVPAGSYYLQVQFISYEPQLFSNVKLGPRNPTYQLGTVNLLPDSETLNEVEVVAEKSTMELQLDKRVFNVGKDLSNLGGSATQILDNIPSVTVDVEGNVSLRGSQNVRILINGRQSGLAGIGSTDALRLLQGDLIERVEVITNPSARYDAEGEVGIINIILKKEKRRGINGAFNFNAGHPDAYGASFNLNYRSGFVNFFGSYGINYRDTPGFGFADQRFFDPETGALTSSFITDQDRSRERLSHTLRVGADFFINDKNTITVSGLYRKSDGNNNTDIQYLDFDGLGNLDSTTVRFQDEDEVDDNVEFEINYKRTFDRKGQELTANFTWLEAIDEENANLFEDNIDNADLPFFQRSFNTENERNFLAQLDYVHPFLANAKFETGFKATLRDIDNDFLVEEQNTDGEYEALEGLDNQYRYQEYVYAAYAIVGNKWGKFSAQAGLRGEFTDIQAGLVGSEFNSDRTYFNLFPSAFLSYELNKANTFQLSYSRRLSRPRFRLLLPFSGFNDSRNFRAGNPDLDPEYTHSIEAGYLKTWKSGNILSSVYYRRRTGVIERITLRDEAIDAIDVPNVTSDEVQNVTFPINLAVENSYGIELTISQDLAKWWSLNGNMNFFQSNSEGEFEGQSYAASATSFNARATSKIDLPWKIGFQQTLRYRGPVNNTQGRRKSLTMIDLAMSKDFLKGNATLTLSVQDLLNNRIWRQFIQGDNFTRDSEFQWRARQFMLNFTYRLNQKKSRGGRGNRGGFDGGDGF